MPAVTDIGIALPATAAKTAAPSVYDVIRAQARCRGDGLALVDLVNASNPALTYAALTDRVDTLAERLRGHIADPGQPVTVLLDRSIDTVVAMLAVLAAGGACCPLDPSTPESRLTATLRNLGARVAVTDGANAGMLPAGTVPVPPVGSGVEPAGARSDPTCPAGAPPPPDALAYVMHTSGSTGRPKGVAMSHRGLWRLIDWQTASGPPGLRTLQFTATSFDVTFQEVLSTLATGGCLVVASEEIRRDPNTLLDTIVSQRIQRLFLPYVALQLLAVAAGRRAEPPACLEHVITAGERLIITPAIRELFAAIPHCRLDNHYGPTEAHLVTSFTLPADRAAWPTVPAIGAPVAGVSCWVLDDQLDPVEDGEVGELYVGGTGLARGYLHDPTLTAAQFVASPYGSRPGERLYRTGDLVRAAGDGTYDFVGRVDEQLKVRGFRVEPAEVENALLSHARVEAAAVGLREVGDGMSVLAAYVQTDGPVPQREVTDHLRGLLPAYMIPSRYLNVPAMPRTATGKIDARALASLDLPAVADPPATSDLAASLPAGSSMAGIITTIWTRVLGHDEFDADDDFFEVGGDSLLATWVVAELGQVLDRQVELSVFLEHSTVGELVATLEMAAPVWDRQPTPSQIVTLRPGPSGRVLYLVHPLGGELMCYRELSRASRAPARLLGIGWAGEPPAFGSSLGDIARTHVAQLRTVQPDGPYLLAGWSFGGVLAFEMARQLTAVGAAVDLLGLFDANPVLDPLTGLPIRDTPFLAMLETVLARLDDPAGGDLAELTSSETWLQLMGAPITAGTSSGYLRTVLQTARACMRAAMDYQPQPYAGPVHLFQAEGSDQARQERLAAAIRELCIGSCATTSIPGDHWGITRTEHSNEAATQLDVALERAGTAGGLIDVL